MNLNFQDIPLSLSKASSDKFINTHNDQDYDVFVEELQKEAGILFSKAERDLWFGLQLTKTFMAAGLWQAALDAAKDALVVATNMQQAEDIFRNLLKEIKEKIQE